MSEVHSTANLTVAPGATGEALVDLHQGSVVRVAVVGIDVADRRASGLRRESRGGGWSVPRCNRTRAPAAGRRSGRSDGPRRGPRSRGCSGRRSSRDETGIARAPRRSCWSTRARALPSILVPRLVEPSFDRVARGARRLRRQGWKLGRDLRAGRLGDRPFGLCRQERRGDSPGRNHDHEGGSRSHSADSRTNGAPPLDSFQSFGTHFGRCLELRSSSRRPLRPAQKRKANPAVAW